MDRQVTVGHRLKLLETHYKSLGGAIEAANGNIQTLQTFVQTNVPANLQDQLNGIQAFLENVGRVLVETTKEHAPPPMSLARQVSGFLSEAGSAGKDGDKQRRPSIIYSQDELIKLIREQLETWSKTNSPAAAAPAPAVKSNNAAPVPYSKHISSKKKAVMLRSEDSFTGNPSNRPAAPRPEETPSSSYSARPKSSDRNLAEEVERLKEIVMSYRKSNVTRDDVLNMLKLDSKDKDKEPDDNNSQTDNSPISDVGSSSSQMPLRSGNSSVLPPYHAMLRKVIAAEVSKLITGKLDRDEYFVLAMELKTDMLDRNVAQVDMMIEQAVAKYDKDNAERASKTETKFKNLTKMLRELEVNMFKMASAPFEQLSLEDWRPDLDKYTAQIQKLEEEHRAAVGKVRPCSVRLRGLNTFIS